MQRLQDEMSDVFATTDPKERERQMNGFNEALEELIWIRRGIRQKPK